MNAGACLVTIQLGQFPNKSEQLQNTVIVQT
jgi:hypothetical protein